MRRKLTEPIQIQTKDGRVIAEYLQDGRVKVYKGSFFRSVEVNSIRQNVKNERLYLINNGYINNHQPPGHKPISLPSGRMAVYTFVYNGVFLKVGQANKNSNARYQSHPYNVGSANSTLAKSILNDPSMSPLVNATNVKQWIKANCERFDVIIDAKHQKVTLNFIEGLLQYKYNPKYEG